jgi:Uncharacterized protein conserved in bacteria
MSVPHKSAGYHSLTPLYHISDVPKLIAFLVSVFDAEETQRTTYGDGRVVHAEVRIGDSRLMLGERWGQREFPAGTHHAYVYVDDVDTAYARAVDLGAVSIMEPANQYWGDRLAGVQDPSGVTWWIATQKEEITPAKARAW